MTTTNAAPRRVPACALQLITSFEGLHDGDKRTPNILEPQADPVGIFTIGWGYALFAAGKPVKDQARAVAIWKARWPNGFGRKEADALLQLVAQDTCDDVIHLLGDHPVNDNELGAMVSLSYNIGVGEPGGLPDFADSSVRRFFLAGDKARAADAFRMWKFSAGHELPGLVRRRDAERARFLMPA